MDTFVGFLCIGVIVGLVWFLVAQFRGAGTSRSASHRAKTSSPRTTAPPPAARRTPPGDHADRYDPPAPEGELFEAWSTKTRHVEVVGESYRRENLGRLFRGQPLHGDRGVELEHAAVLSADAANPYHGRAVAVFISGLHVGYLSREDAEAYFPNVSALGALGLNLVVDSRQWARIDHTATIRARVSLRLPNPEGIFPANDVPAGVHLPTGSTVQVTKEDEHMEAISPWLDPAGGEVHLAVTLQPITDIRPRSAVEAVQVRVDGNPVGILSKVASDNLLPLVKHVHSSGHAAVARAVLKGNALKADITLHVAKSQDVDPAWVASIGPVVQPQHNPEHRPGRPEPEW